MRKTIPLATAIAVLAAVTIVTGLVRNDVSLDSKTTAAPVAPLQRCATIACDQSERAKDVARAILSPPPPCQSSAYLK